MSKPKKVLVYLATPYTHPDPAVMRLRFIKVTRVAAKLMKKGVFVFSPITHSHSIAMAGDLPKSWKYWMQYDTLILEICSKVIVLMLKGWKESKGVKAEIKLAGKLGIPVEYLEPGKV